MITREADYAMRVALFLARARRQGRPRAACAAVAEAMDVPYRFLRKIVKRMVAAGLIVSARGKGGGLRLARPPQRVSLLDIIEAMGPANVQLSRCVLRPETCGRSGYCRVHRALRAVQKGVDQRLAALKLDTLA